MTRFFLTLFTLHVVVASSLFVGVSYVSSAEQNVRSLQERVDAIKAEFTPDLRLDLFEATFENDARKATIATTSAQARDAVRQLSDEFPDWTIDAALYPEENPELRGRWRALTNFSTIQLQKGPDHAAEWGTQSLMGMPVRVLKKVDGWILIQNFDGYLGYTTAGGVCTKTKEEYDAWLASKRVVFLDMFGFVYSKPDDSSSTISDLVAGCVLVWKNEEVENGFYRVETPDGRLGWTPEKSVQEWNAWLASRELNANDLITTARRFLGAPYVWGGDSTKGVDCSGLVSQTFLLNGYNILRDVSQLRREGIDVDLSQGWKSFQPGDLLIFGKKRADGSASWRHVAIYIGDGRFIHSVTSVHESSLDPSSSDYDPGNARELIKVVRMIGAPYTKHFHPIGDNPCFQVAQ